MLFKDWRSNLLIYIKLLYSVDKDTKIFLSFSLFKRYLEKRTIFHHRWNWIHRKPCRTSVPVTSVAALGISGGALKLFLAVIGRGHPRLCPEEPSEMVGIRKAQLFGNVAYGQIGMQQHGFRFFQ